MPESDNDTNAPPGPPLLQVGGAWRLVSDFVPTDSLTAFCAGGSGEAKLCDNTSVHAIASCPMIHSLDQKVLVGKEFVRLRTFDQSCGAFKYLLKNPEHRGLLCGNVKPHPPAGCKFVHLLPHVTVQKERIPVAELLENAAIAHLKEFPYHQGRWCTSSTEHDILACPFVHWKDNAPKRPPPKRAAASSSKSASPAREASPPRREEQEDILLAQFTEAKSQSVQPHQHLNQVASADNSRLGTDDWNVKAPPAKAGTVLTLADVLPSSVFARVLAAAIILVIAWLFAS